MPNKNDLTAIKVNNRETLKGINRVEPNPIIKLAWRKPKPVLEKQSELVGLRFTKEEYMILKEMAGLVPVATYLKNAIMTNTTIFK